MLRPEPAEAMTGEKTQEAKLINLGDLFLQVSYYIYNHPLKW